MVYRKIEIMCTEIGDLIMGDMQLVETVDLMLSEDHQNRFKAEFYQLAIRRYRLANMIEKYKHNELDFTPQSDLEILQRQENAMLEYMSLLEIRADQENIDLELDKIQEILPHIEVKDE